jgi:hypothetical protein
MERGPQLFCYRLNWIPPPPPLDEISSMPPLPQYQSFHILLSYNLLVLMGGPTFLIKDTILYTYMNGTSIIRVMTTMKIKIKNQR